MSDAEIKVGGRWKRKTMPAHIMEIKGVGSIRGATLVDYEWVDGSGSGRVPSSYFLRDFEPVAPAAPAHYDFAIQPIDAVEAWGLNHRLSCAIEYIARHKGKGGLDDLEKALWHLKREIAKQKEGAK